MTKKKKEKLEQISYIGYAITFSEQTKTLVVLEGKVNLMSQAFGLQLSFKIRKTNFRTQKIDDTILEIYKIIVSIFFILNKDNAIRFLKKTIL